MSELDKVKGKIAVAEAELEHAREILNLPINDPAIVALNQKITALYAKEERLESSLSGATGGGGSTVGSQPTLMTYWFVAFKVSGSMSKVGWRSRIFVLASSCMAFYHVDKAQSIYYEGNDLVIKLLFESQRDCRQFHNDLFALHFRFSIVMPLSVIEDMREIHVNYKPSPVLANHYVTTDFDSPNHSMNAADYAVNSTAGSTDNLSVCTISDPYAKLQMIENPDHPFLRGLKMYRCHLESQASNKKQKLNQNNILYMSWPMHQRFDGLNLVGDKHLVPSVAFKFIKAESEIVEVVTGFPCQKHKVTFSIESNNDLALLNAVGSTLKEGSEFNRESNCWTTFVHVDSYQEFKSFLDIKYKIAKKLWEQNAPIGEDIENEQMQLLEQNATLEVISD